MLSGGSGRLERNKRKSLRARHGRRHGAALLLGAGFSLPAVAHDILNLPLEQLLEVKVISASRYEQKSADVAAAPQVLGADEIRASGARNLAEVLELFGGVHLHNDGIYTRLGSRGFLRTGDYNARVLLLIDGRRFNELAYDGAYLGEEGPIELSMIERVEYIPGPGSSVYGSNALFGVVNVVTRLPGDMPRANAGGEISQRGRARLEGGFALKFDNGAAGMLQLSRFQSPGRRREAAELDGALPGGQVATRDREWANRLFARLDHGAFTASAVYVNREVNTANGAYFTAPEFERQPNRDRMTSIDLAYTKEFAPRYTLAAHLVANEYSFRSYAVSHGPGNTLPDNVQTAEARWIDADIKLLAKWHQNATLVAGAEMTRVPELEFVVAAPAEGRVLVDRKSSLTRWGLYAQNDWSIAPTLTLSAGARLDGQSARDNVFSPRVGAVYRPAADTAVKLQHGVAFRNPNAYESFYDVPAIGYRTNASLQAERVTTKELTLEREFGAGMSLRVTGFRNEIDKLIDFAVDPADGLLVFSNIGAATVKGVQSDLHLLTTGGWRVRAGATFQRGTSREAGLESALRNSPRRLGHVALFTPRRHGLFGSLIWHYAGPQHGRDMTFGGYGVAHATLIADEFAPGWSATLGVRNLFDRAFRYPLGDEFIQPAEHGAGRELWLGLRVRF